jgi:hypothetical protein
MGAEGFDHDHLREVFADSETNVADLADDIRVLAKEPDPSFLAKSELSKADGDFGGRCQLTHFENGTRRGLGE